MMGKTEFLEILKNQLDFLCINSQTVDGCCRFYENTSAMIDISKTICQLDQTAFMFEEIIKKLEKQLQIIYRFSEDFPKIENLSDISSAINDIVRAIISLEHNKTLRKSQTALNLLHPV